MSHSNFKAIVSKSKSKPNNIVYRLDLCPNESGRWGGTICPHFWKIKPPWIYFAQYKLRSGTVGWRCQICIKCFMNGPTPTMCCINILNWILIGPREDDLVLIFRNAMFLMTFMMISAIYLLPKIWNTHPEWCPCSGRNSLVFVETMSSTMHVLT